MRETRGHRQHRENERRQTPAPRAAPSARQSAAARQRRGPRERQMNGLGAGSRRKKRSDSRFRSSTWVRRGAPRSAARHARRSRLPVPPARACSGSSAFQRSFWCRIRASKPELSDVPAGHPHVSRGPCRAAATSSKKGCRRSRRLQAGAGRRRLSRNCARRASCLRRACWAAVLGRKSTGLSKLPMTLGPPSGCSARRGTFGAGERRFQVGAMTRDPGHRPRPSRSAIRRRSSAPRRTRGSRPKAHDSTTWRDAGAKRAAPAPPSSSANAGHDAAPQTRNGRQQPRDARTEGATS